METASTAEIEVGAGTPDPTPTDTGADSSSEFSYATHSDDDILGIGEDDAAGEAPAEDADAKTSAEAKSVEGKEAQPTTPDPAKPAEEPEVPQIEPEQLKQIFKKNPELRNSWYSEKAYREVFPTVAEARAIKEIFPNAEVAKQAASHQQMLIDMDQMYIKDPAQFAARMYKGNPEAYKAFISSTRESLYNVDPNAYRESMAKPAVRDTVENLKEIARESQDEDLAAALDILEDRLGFKAEAARAAAAGPVDPRIADYERLKTEAKAYGEGRTAAFSRAVDDVYFANLDHVIAAAVGKPSGMSEAALTMVKAEIRQEIGKVLAARPDLKAVYETKKRFGDRSVKHAQDAAAFLLQYAQQFVPRAASARMNAWTKEILAANKAELAAKDAVPKRKDIGSGGVVRGNPKTKGRIDYSKMSDDDILNDD